MALERRRDRLEGFARHPDPVPVRLRLRDEGLRRVAERDLRVLRERDDVAGVGVRPRLPERVAGRQRRLERLPRVVLGLLDLVGRERLLRDRLLRLPLRLLDLRRSVLRRAQPVA
jgi:hypothetical protein